MKISAYDDFQPLSYDNDQLIDDTDYNKEPSTSTKFEW
jgi:hypothetical protein